MEALVRQRALAKRQLTKLVTYANSGAIDHLSKPDLEVRMQALEERWREFQQAQNGIYALTDEEGLEAQMSAADAEEEKYFLIKVACKRRLEVLTSVAPREPTPPSAPAHPLSQVQDTRLPPIKLPSFSGDYTDWLAFRETFKALVDSNTALSKIQKFHYLRSALHEAPRTLVESLPISDKGYDDALLVLEERYHNKRLLVSALLTSLFEVPPAIKNPAVELRHILDTVSTSLKNLDSLGVMTTSWDPLLIHVVTSKMDTNTRRQWELDTPGTDLLTYEELATFITTRIRALEATQGLQLTQRRDVTPFQSNVGNTRFLRTQTKVPQVSTTQKERFMPYATVPHATPAAHSSSCLYCHGAHTIHSCNQFRSLTVPQRYSAAKESKLCFNCLGPHLKKDCRSPKTCRECDQRHHTALHEDPPGPPLQVGVCTFAPKEAHLPHRQGGTRTFHRRSHFSAPAAASYRPTPFVHSPLFRHQESTTHAPVILTHQTSQWRKQNFGQLSRSPVHVAANHATTNRNSSPHASQRSTTRAPSTLSWSTSHCQKGDRKLVHFAHRRVPIYAT